MKQYLYYHEHFKEYYIHNEQGAYGKNIKLIGEVSEIVAAYQNRGKSPYNNAIEVKRTEECNHDFKDLDNFSDRMYCVKCDKNMKVKGIIRIKGIDGDINVQTDCSKNSFIALTKVLFKTDILIRSMYFEYGLTDEELIALTND